MQGMLDWIKVNLELLRHIVHEDNKLNSQISKNHNRLSNY